MTNLTVAAGLVTAALLLNAFVTTVVGDGERRKHPNGSPISLEASRAEQTGSARDARQQQSFYTDFGGVKLTPRIPARRAGV